MPRVKLLLNHPRIELLEDGWGITQTASNVSWGSWEEKDGKWTWRKTGMPQGFARERQTGVIMLMPKFLGSQMDVLQKVDWDFGNPDVMYETQTNQIETYSMIAARTGSESALVEILHSLAIQTILSAIDLRNIARSKQPLNANEPFSAIIQPGGVASSRVPSLFAMSFSSERFLLSITPTGEFTLYFKVSETETKLIARESYKAGGVDHRMPVQVSVIPWGPSYIGIHFSNDVASAWARGAPGTGGKSDSAFLINLADHGIDCPWDDSFAQHIKTPPGHVTIAVPAVRTPAGGAPSYLPFVAWTFSRGMYEGGTVKLGPITLDEKRTNPPELFMRGYFDYDGTRPDAPRAIGTPKGRDGTPWMPANYLEGYMELQMLPSPSGRQSPELWHWDVGIPEATFTPPWEPIDRSADWSMIRLQLSARSEASRLEVKLHNSPDSRIFFRPGPIRLEIDDVGVWDGYGIDREPTPEGPAGGPGVKGRMREEIHAHDMWHRLNTTTIAREIAVDNRSVAFVLKKVIKRAGFRDSDFEIDPDLDDLFFGDFPSPDEVKSFNSDTYVGDVVRDIQKFVNVQFADGLRVRWEDDLWKIYFATAWDQATLWPDNIILLDSSLMAVWDGTPLPARTDTARWNADQLVNRERFLLAGNETSIEITSSLPAFNCLEVVAQTQGTGKGDAVIGTIPKAPQTMADTNHPRFEGRIRKKIIAPPEALSAKDDAEIMKWARVIYDREQRRGITAQLGAEWQPFMRPDAFVMILGRNQEGEPCSYGCWRVERIDIQMDSDADIEGNDTSWKWEANYELVYQAKTDHPLFPMIAEDGE